MTLNDLLKISGIDIDKKIKLVKHQDNSFKISTKELYNEGRINYYQQCQSKDVFNGCKYIICFIGHDYTKAKFIGIYEVVSKCIPATIPDVKYKDFWKSGFYFYDLRDTEYLADLTDRLIIEWGKATRSWFQWLNNDKPKEVISILQKAIMKSSLALIILY